MFGFETFLIICGLFLGEEEEGGSCTPHPIQVSAIPTLDIICPHNINTVLLSKKETIIVVTLLFILKQFQTHREVTQIITGLFFSFQTL